MGHGQAADEQVWEMENSTLQPADARSVSAACLAVRLILIERSGWPKSSADSFFSATRVLFQKISVEETLFQKAKKGSLWRFYFCNKGLVSEGLCNTGLVSQEKKKKQVRLVPQLRCGLSWLAVLFLFQSPWTQHGRCCKGPWLSGTVDWTAVSCSIRRLPRRPIWLIYHPTDA